MSAVPQIPVLSAAFEALFVEMRALLDNLHARAEAAQPGAGALLNEAYAKLEQLRVGVDVPNIAKAFLSEVGSALSRGDSPIHHRPADLAG